MEYSGPATVVVDDRDVGQVRVQLRLGALDPDRGTEPWSGRILNTDYVVWGMAGNRLRLRLPDGRAGECVVRSTGEIIGFDQPPFGAAD